MRTWQSWRTCSRSNVVCRCRLQCRPASAGWSARTWSTKASLGCRTSPLLCLSASPYLTTRTPLVIYVLRHCIATHTSNWCSTSKRQCPIRVQRARFPLYTARCAGWSANRERMSSDRLIDSDHAAMHEVAIDICDVTPPLAAARLQLPAARVHWSAAHACESRTEACVTCECGSDMRKRSVRQSTCASRQHVLLGSRTTI